MLIEIYYLIWVGYMKKDNSEKTIFYHYLRKFIFRLTVVISVFIIYFINRKYLDFTKFFQQRLITPVHLLWIAMGAEMVIQLLPFSRVSKGCLKQFGKYYIEPENKCSEEELKAFVKGRHKGAIKVLIVWILGNAVFGTLFYLNIIGTPELLLLSFLYYIGDLVCVVFFCPFQVLFMRNRCCTNCRIFAWAHFMMATPLIWIPSFYGYTLFFLGIVILLKWEIVLIKHPERFYEGSNAALTCTNCTDKLCKIRKPVNEKLNIFQYIKNLSKKNSK